MALFRCGSGNANINKYAVFGGRYNAANGCIVYDNGSGETVIDTSLSTLNTVSDLFNVQFVSPDDYVFTFKEECDVIGGSGTTSVTGHKNINDTITLSRGNDTCLFAYN